MHLITANGDVRLTFEFGEKRKEILTFSPSLNAAVKAATTSSAEITSSSPDINISMHRTGHRRLFNVPRNFSVKRSAFFFAIGSAGL